MSINAWKWAALVGGLMAAPAWAQMIPTEDFSKRFDYSQVALSPDGKYLALAVPNEEETETKLQVFPLDGSREPKVLRFGNQQHVSDLIWSDNDTFVVSRAEKRPLRERLVSNGELWSSNVDGKNQKPLFAYIPDDSIRAGRRKDEGFAFVESILRDEPGMVLVNFVCWNCGEEPPTVIYKVDTKTGNRKEVERYNKEAYFSYDNTGRARLRTSLDKEDEPVLHYRPTPDSDWQPVPATLAGYTMGSLAFDKDNNTAYAEISDKREPTQYYRVDFAKGTRERLIGREDASIGKILYGGYNDVPFGITYDSDKPTIRYLDNNSEWAKLHAGLMKAFPGQMIDFYSFSRDDNVLLFRAWSDRNPGNFYIFNRDTKKVRLVGELQPWLKPERLAPVRPFEFKASDGLKLFGFYTARANVTGPQPMVVMPHGGPYGVADDWSYDRDAQFLASRGYAVLQVNYRGSGGRGNKFMTSGYKEWGGKLVDDVADGVKWAIDNKLADPNRICIYGSSYGGYAALQGTIRYPELYKCAIGYVGVYDLTVMYKEGDIKQTRSGRRFLDRTLGDDQAALIAASPARNVEKVKVPVMLVQGTLDRRVPMAQFEALERAFRKAKVPIETMVVSGEGHGFVKPENITDLNNRVAKFLEGHIGPGTPAPAAAAAKPVATTQN